MLAREVY